MMRTARLFALLVIALGAIVAISSLTISGPAWNPQSAFRNTTINCTWVAAPDTSAQNITIFRNGLIYNSTWQNITEGMLSTHAAVSASDLTKGDRWTCRVRLHNETDSVEAETNITILNSPPTTEGAPAGIFNAGGQDVGYLVQITEDTTMTIDANATDADGDTLTYLHADEFCTRTSSSAGTYACSPTQTDLGSNQPTLVNITFTATDGQNVGGRTITFNVTPSNDPPAAALANRTTPANQSLNYTFTVTDEENSYPFSFQLIVPAEIADRTSLTRLNTQGTSMSFYYDASTIDYNDVGLWNVSINITDNSTGPSGGNDSRSAAYNFTLNITPVGRRPYFTNITPAGPYVLLQGEPVQINISVNDIDPNSTIAFLVNTNRMNITTLKADTNTSDARAQINYTPTNDDVGNFTVVLTARDQETLTNTTVLNFSVTNVNDAPLIYERSASPANTQQNRNMSNITAYANTLLVFDVNATDIDIQWGDSIAFSDNASLFDINATSGRIRFTPTDADIQDGYAVNITVTDIAGASASRMLILSVRGNQQPYFNATVPRLNCTTKATCTFNLASVSTDPDPGDSVALYSLTAVSGNLSTFSYNETTGRINFTTVKTDIGNYTFNLTITDTHGATNSTLLNVSVNNTPEAPNLTRFNFTNETIVETHLFTYDLMATDDDYLIAAGENVTFSTNLTLAHTITPMAVNGTTARALLSFTPDLGQNGTYSVRITATDAFGLNASRTIAVTVLAKAAPPNITMVRPWGSADASHILQNSWASTNETQFLDGETSITLPENTQLPFNVTVEDPRPLTYRWSINNTTVATSQAYTRTFDYFSAGSYVIVLNVSNDRLESARFTWNLNVTNVNRPPQLLDFLESPIEANGTIVFADYFTLNNGQKYFDPDDDLDNDGQITGDENYSLTFTAATDCAVAQITTTGANLRVAGTSIGSCSVIFNATDAYGASQESNIVNITIVDVPQGSTETPTSSNSGGGGASSTTPTFIPLNKKVEVPKAFNIIAPKLVTIYDNRSVVIPLIINNSWTGPLKMVRLEAEINATGVKAEFDQDLFEEIPVNETREVKLTVTNYRIGGNYEIKVTGNVSDPPYQDSALILLNSIEQSSEGESANVKVTFANDLLNQNPECQELNEILTQAKQKIADGNLKEGQQLVESVINGCKYLVSLQQNVQEKPSRMDPMINIDDLSLKAIMIGVLTFVVLSTLAFLIYYHYTHKPEDDI